MEAEIFSFPRWKRTQPGWSYTFGIGDRGPLVKMGFGGHDLMDFQMPWDDFGWYVPALWPFMALQAIAIGGSE